MEAWLTATAAFVNASMLFLEQPDEKVSACAYHAEMFL